MQVYVSRVTCGGSNSCPAGYAFTTIPPISGGELIATCVKN
jgi:hypothetical protein